MPDDPWSYVGRIKFDTNLHDAKAIAFLVNMAGSQNVLLGTDSPFGSALPNTIDVLASALPIRADFDAVTSGNAAAWFRFGQPAERDMSKGHGRITTPV